MKPDDVVDVEAIKRRVEDPWNTPKETLKDCRALLTALAAATKERDEARKALRGVERRHWLNMIGNRSAPCYCVKDPGVPECWEKQNHDARCVDARAALRASS